MLYNKKYAREGSKFQVQSLRFGVRVKVNNLEP